MGRIKNIEFLRIVGCIAIVMLHLFFTKIGHMHNVPFYHYWSMATKNGAKAVDLFFMLSGLFFAITYNPALTTGKFLLKKIIRLYPVYLFGLIAFFIGTLISSEYNFSIYNAIFSALGFNSTIFVKGSTGHVSAFWYVTTMLWTLLLLSGALKNFDKNKIKYCMSIIVFFAYGFIISSGGGKIDNPYINFGGITTMGMLRGIAGISVGYLIGDWYKENIKKIKEWNVSIEGQILLTIIEASCLYFIIKYMTYVKFTFKNDTLFLISFILIIVLFLLKKGFISRLLDTDIWNIFSKYTYSIYLSHQLVFMYLAALLWNNSMKFVVKHPIMNCSLTLSLVLIVGVMVYHLVEKPCAAYLKKRWLSE